MRKKDPSLITNQDIKNIDTSALNEEQFLNVVKFLSLLALIGIAIMIIQNIKNKKKYIHTNKNGEEKPVSLDFTKDDLQLVYEDLAKIPMEQ